MEAHLTYLGVELAGTRSRFHYAALDSAQRVLALGSGGADAVLAFAAGQAQCLAAVDAPAPPSGGPTGPRLAEQTLRQAGVMVTCLPESGHKLPAWMRNGFELYQHLHHMGYKAYAAEGEALQILETNAEGVFLALLERAPFEYGTLEGRIQRQLALKDAGVSVPDAMDFFEEITRHRLMRGILPTEKIYSAGELGALAAAHVAWLAGNQAERLEALGSADDGLMYLPVSAALHPAPPDERRSFATLFPMD